jgi:DNA-nicking Smr family endonuclease
MRKVTAEERELFLAALAGRLPAKAVRAVAQVMARKAVEQHHPSAKEKPAPPGSRRTSDAEVLLFLEAIGLRAPAVVKPAPLPPVKAVTRTVTGLDGNTKKKLDRGEMAPDAKLDLHGLTEAAAHGALLTFLIAAHRRGDRLVLVVTGKGEAGRGVLKAMVPRWLQEAPMKKIIADQRWAHRRHGGDGALYVYLRKSPRS